MMKRKILYGVSWGIALSAVGLILGMIAGFNIGGNYFTAFEFFGGRRYEAVGYLCAMVGAVLGAILGVLTGVKISNTREKKN